MGVAAGSFSNSIGMGLATSGQTSASVSFGIGSYDFTNNKWGFLGKKGNKWYENMAYSFGAMANLGNVVALFGC
jgi:hypothetical protein